MTNFQGVKNVYKQSSLNKDNKLLLSYRVETSASHAVAGDFHKREVNFVRENVLPPPANRRLGGRQKQCLFG